MLYLLHGGGGDHTDWTRKTDVEALTEGVELFVVMPEAGGAGWYTDWYNNGAGGPPKWESFHIGELIPWIDASYRTVASREGRAIAGLSMGGFGAFSYATRHPDLFAAVAAFSGAIDTNLVEPIAATVVDGIALAGYPPFAPPGSLWGLRLLEEERWRSHNPWDLAGNLAGLHVTIRTGNGLPGGTNPGIDPLELGVHEMSVSTHRRLDALGVPHVFEDYGPGAHVWPLWERDLHLTLPDMLASFGAPAPLPFTYVSGESEFSVYGFAVRFERAVRELSRLADVRPEGFSITGTGIAHVTSAPWYEPGEMYEVNGEAVVADSAGCLAFDVDLGPSSAFQQYTAPADLLQAILGDAYFRTVDVTIGG